MREIRYGQRRNRVVAAGVLAATVAATSAHAGGLFLYEMATPDLGTASAGRAAAADNAATAFGNPAGMTRLDQSQMLVGIQPAYGITHFDKGNDTTVSGGNGGNALGFIPGLGGYYVYSATPDLKFGFSLGSDFGLSARYQSNWSGRYYGTAVGNDHPRRLSGRRLSDQPMALGRRRRANHLRPAELKTAINDVLDGGDGQHRRRSNDVGDGGIAGILIEPVEGTRFGVTYTSQVKLDFKDKPKTNNLRAAVLKEAFDLRGLTGRQGRSGLDHSQQVMVSGYHDLTDTVAIMGNVVWQQWSQFGQPSLEVTSTTSRKATANLNYDDTWGFALGGRYKFAPDWQWSLGVAFDTSPISKSERTPALPLDQQIRVGTGVQYALNDHATIGAAYEYLNLGEADIEPQPAVAGTLQGNYATNEIHWFNVTLSWKF